MRTASFLGVLLVTLTSCAPAPEGGAYVTYLGQDTLAVERFVDLGDRVEADVMLRTPNTTLRNYVLEFDDDGMMRRFEATVRDPASLEAPPLSKDLLLAASSGYTLFRTRDGEVDTLTVDATASALPFLDMIHWPFEIMLKRAVSAQGEVFEQPLIAGSRVLPFELRQMEGDSMTVKHPFRGTMGVTVDPEGRLQLLDAGLTTRKVRVHRRESIDVGAVAAHFAAKDAAGMPFGPLSGRGETLATIKGAQFRVDYGTPVKRGRDIFGALVPYGQVWRTGANRATHFETDTDLQFGSLNVPAGTYTLYTIPEADGGTLMINTQTGQGGTTYNADMDLGRVSLQAEPLEEAVEVFTIGVEETDQGGSLQIMWDRTALTVPFSILN